MMSDVSGRIDDKTQIKQDSKERKPKKIPHKYF
jgi:hypothetical protein